jgi:hypothetical protein
MGNYIVVLSECISESDLYEFCGIQGEARWDKKGHSGTICTIYFAKQRDDLTAQAIRCCWRVGCQKGFEGMK